MVEMTRVLSYRLRPAERKCCRRSKTILIDGREIKPAFVQPQWFHLVSIVKVDFMTKLWKALVQPKAHRYNHLDQDIPATSAKELHRVWCHISLPAHFGPILSRAAALGRHLRNPAYQDFWPVQALRRRIKAVAIWMQYDSIYISHTKHMYLGIFIIIR